MRTISKRLKEFEQKYNAYLKKGNDKENAQKIYNKELQKCSELESAARGTKGSSK